MDDFTQLYQTYFPTVYRICLARFRNPEFAKEIAQDAFAAAFVEFGKLRRKESFLSWITTTALRIGYKKARLDQARYNPLPLEDLRKKGWDPTSPENLPIEESNYIRRWIVALDEPDQQLFLLRHYYDMTEAAISREAGRPASTVNRRLRKLNEKLAADFHRDFY